MSWKNTDPLELWKTSTTLPVPAKKSLLSEDDLHGYGTAKTRFWMSVNEMSPRRRAEFFRHMIKAWPYPWERRAAKLGIVAIPATTFLTGAYTTFRITTDIYLVNPKLSVYQKLNTMPFSGRIPVCAISPVIWAMTQASVYNLLYKQYIQQEGQVTKASLFGRACAISVGLGIIAPLISAPPMATYTYSIYKTKMGMRPFPEGTVFDLLCHTYEGSRAVWRKIPMLVAINIFVAFAAVGAMIWSGERIHNAIDIDPSLVHTMMAEHSEKKSIFSSIIDTFTTYKRFMDNTTMGKMQTAKPVTGTESWQDLRGAGRWDRVFGPREPILEDMEFANTNTKM